METLIGILLCFIKNFFYMAFITSISVGIFYLLFLCYGFLVEYVSGLAAVGIIVILFLAFVKTIEEIIC